MRKFIAFLLMIVPVCIATPVFGANVTVTGTVVCEDGKGQNEPCVLLGLQEFEGEKALSNGSTTDESGKFSLKVKVGNRIKFTYVGMEDKWIDVKAGVTDLGTIEMKTSSQNLGEVVVVDCSMKGAKELGIKARDKYNDCVPTACIEPRWKLKGEGKKAKCEEQKCKIENGTGEWVKDGDSWACKVKSCKKGYDKTDDQTGCREMLKKCTDAQAKEHPNATKTGIKKGTEICIAQDCKCGFELKDEKCVAWPENKECTADTKPRLPDDAASAKMVCENDKAVCKIDKCVSDDYELKDNKCESKNKQPCTPEDKNATAGEYKKRDGKLVCVITSCKENYSVDKDNNKCVAGMVLSEEDQKARIAELEENAQKMKDKEQSMENKLLGAAGMGMTGAGLSKSLSAGAEQKADEAAELDMAAYLATMHCNYAPGKNVKGGEKEVELPGANSLMPLYTEYVALANDLKVRKAALGMQPGIESEAILDGATSGLYDDVALGKTGGAYASLARALSDPNSEDAKKWAAQKEEAAKDKKTGTTLAAVGAIGSAVANIAINKNAPKESSDEIEAEYDKKRVSADTLEKGDIDGTDGSNDDNKGTVGGTVPQSDKIADKECSPACNADTQNCVDGVCVEKVKKCASNQDLVDGECKPKCGTDETRDDSGECVKKITEKKQRTATCPSGQIFVPDGSGCDTRENILARDKTEWYPHSGAGMKYYGDDFYQSGSDQKYYDYLLEVNEACVKAGGTLNRKMKILEDYKNIKGGYSTYLFTSCDFKDGDKSNKSMRCKNTFGKYNFTQSCPENGLYRCCEILAPKK